MAIYKYNDKEFSFAEIKALFPFTSFPAMPTVEDLALLGVTLIPDADSPPEAQLADAKAMKSAQLSERFNHAEQYGHFGSSIGFEVDATERANRDVSGLITMLESAGQTQAMFCDYGNTMHEVTLEQLKTLQLELIVHGQMLYARKWELRERIANAESPEILSKIEINFDDLPAPQVITA